MKASKRTMEDAGLVWNEKKCSVADVKHCSLSSDQGGTVVRDAQVIKALKEGESYKFLGVLEDTNQKDELVLRTLSVICPTPLSDYCKVIASNQYALPILAYALWTQTWPLSELQ